MQLRDLWKHDFLFMKGLSKHLLHMFISHLLTNINGRGNWLGMVQLGVAQNLLKQIENYDHF